MLNAGMNLRLGMLEQSVKDPDAIRLGIVGLGVAAALMIRAAVSHPKIILQAGADPRAEPRDAFAKDFVAAAYASIEELCKDPSVEVVYIASPHEFHIRHARFALENGKHVLVEKPLGLIAEECQAIVELEAATGLTVIVGHTHGFAANVREIGRLSASGVLGRLGMILNFNYTDFLFRPKRPEEFDVALGGGVTFNQVTHQVEIARVIANSPVNSVRANLGALDRNRKTNGNCNAFLEFENGASAALIYSGYDFFDSDEFFGWAGETGNTKMKDQQGATRARHFAAISSEAERHRFLGYGGRQLPTELPHLPHFGVLLVTFERGDVRLTPNGLTLYGENAREDLPVPRGIGRPGHGDALDEIYRSVRLSKKSMFDASWGKATLEVILAINESAREMREIRMTVK
jgi:phthalate 4,5-cis-dihydrodiol dehydrogenase